MIITSDHGENFYEHGGAFYKHYGVYDSSLRIPLLLSFPGKLPEKKRISEVVEAVDIAPTILELLEIAQPAQFQGRSALPLLYDDNSEWNSVAHGMYFGNKRNFISLRSGDWKIILKTKQNHKEFELYHIPSDPNELVNQIEIEPEIADSFKETMIDWIDKEFRDAELVYTPGRIYQKEKEYDKETVKLLKSMGYLK